MNPFLKRIRVSNFKSIVAADVELRPLTVIVGRNSSGKSSLLQSILLSAQHLSSDFSADNRISLNRDLVSLGTFKEVLNKDCLISDTVGVAIETSLSSWEVEFGRDMDSQGSDRPDSPEAIVHWFRIDEKRPSLQSRQFEEVRVEFKIGETIQRTAPLLFAQSSTNLRRAVIGRGDGTVRVLNTEGGTPVERSFEYCLFVPQAQRRFHPVPLETVDFFHYLVEQFFNALAKRLRIEEIRRSRSAAGLVAKSQNDDDGNKPWTELRKEYFEQVLSPSSSLSDFLNESGTGDIVADGDQIVGKLADNVLKLNMNFRASVRRFAEIRGLGNITRAVNHGTVERAMTADGISALKEELIPFLQSVFGSTSLLVLKPVSLSFSTPEPIQDDQSIDDTGSDLMWSLNEGRENLTGAAKNFYYLGPIRDVDFPAPQLRDPRNLGPKGEQAVAVLAHEAFAVNSYPTPATMGRESVVVEFGVVLKQWLEHLGLARGVVPADHGRDRPRINVVIDDDGRTVDLRSVGQGLSQVLPVLMQCLLASPSGSVVVVEQPELHLHPRLESQLADFFLACARTGRQIVIETHSEHLINQLRLQIADDESDDTKNLVKIYFAEQQDGSTSFKSADLDAYGGLAGDWPPEFLDLNLEAAERLVDAAIKKRLSELGRDEDDED